MANGKYRLVVRDDPKSPAAEAIRTLRTNLQFVGLDKPLKSVMLTSAGPAEGKTSIAGNLAVSVAQSGSRVVLVGADLRKPSIHKIFSVSNDVGVTNVLLGQATLDQALQDTDVEGLQVLAAGPTPPNPAELVSSQSMKELVRTLTERVDFVVLDATPIVAVTDAAVLARFVDGTLLVVAMNETPRELVRQAKEQLEQVNAKILGVVANKVAIHSQEAYYYYYDGGREVAAANGRAKKAGAPGVFRRLFSR